MIDLHFHILPGVDDGSPDMETSIAMARLAVSDGIHTIVCTSHINAETEGLVKIERLNQVRRSLQAEIDAQEIPLTLLGGAEWMLTPDLIEAVKVGGRIATTRSFLYELSQYMPVEAAEMIVEDANFAGFHPILSHPERYRVFVQGDAVAMLRKLITMGCTLQITSASLLGDFGPSVRRCAENIVRAYPNNIIIASDAHNIRTRPPRMSAGMQALDAIQSGLSTRVIDRIESLINPC